MTQKHEARKASPRDIEGSSVLTSRARGRTPAPRSSSWLPLAAKIAAAVFGAAVLAIIGANAGAHTPASTDTLAPSVTAPLALSPPLALAPPESAPSPPMHDGTTEPSRGVLADGRVVLNLATEDDLVRLPGIGPARARAIVALRQRLAKFRAIEDLLRVKGIGRKILKRIKPGVVLDRPPEPDGGAVPARE